MNVCNDEKLNKKKLRATKHLKPLFSFVFTIERGAEYL
jgi:hypothetical protein